MRAPQDDRVLLSTKALSAIIVPFLIAALPLYLFPSDTGWFAWSISPRMTPLIMGAGYLTGAYFFTRVVFARHWHRVHIGFLPIATFTVFELIATLRHLDRFDRNVAFWIWLALYAVTPILVPLAWLRNRATDPGSLEPGDVHVPRPIRGVLAAAGLGQIAVAVILLVSPSTMIEIWPWKLTPLTAGVLAGWFALPGVGALIMAIDGRWSAIRILLESQLLWLVLVLAGAARAWEEFDTSSAATPVFVGGVVLLLVGVGALAILMNGLQRRARYDFR